MAHVKHFAFDDTTGPAVPVLAFTSSYLKIPNMYVNGKGVEIGHLFSLEMVLNIHEKLFTFPKTTYQIATSEKYGTFCVSKLLNGLPATRLWFVECRQVR